MRLAASSLVLIALVVQTAEAAAPLLLTTKVIALKDNANPIRRKLVISSKDDGIAIGDGNGSADDPTLAGATLRILTAAGCGGPCDTTYSLPAENWRLIGKWGEDEGYQYSDRLLLAGPVKKISVRAGRVLTIIGQGDQLAHELSTDPSPVDIVLTLGAQQSCFQSGGTTLFKVSRKFTASNAPAPAACP